MFAKSCYESFGTNWSLCRRNVESFHAATQVPMLNVTSLQPHVHFPRLIFLCTRYILCASEGLPRSQHAQNQTPRRTCSHSPPQNSELLGQAATIPFLKFQIPPPFPKFHNLLRAGHFLINPSSSSTELQYERLSSSSPIS